MAKDNGAGINDYEELPVEEFDIGHHDHYLA